MNLAVFNAFAAAAVLASVAAGFLYLSGVFTPRCQFRQRGLLVNSSQCRIPDIDPMDACTAPLVVHDMVPTVCSPRPPLTYTARRQGRHQLRVATHAATHYGVDSAEQLQCCYALIRRETETTNRLGACVDFARSALLPRGAQLLLVRCADRSAQRQVYSNLHVVARPPVGYEHLTRASASRRRMSVVLLGVDSMSRLDFERNMPRTAARLRATGWQELRGYNKVARNTLPNLMALLTGLSKKRAQFMGCFYPGGNSTYDHCPFLWKEFKEAGYVTVYAEECLKNNFRYDARGFSRQPTDFYLPTLTLAADGIPRADAEIKRDFCFGEARAVDVVLRHLVDLVEVFKQGLFGTFWISNFSHNYENLAATEDATFLDLLDSLNETGALETTLFVFLSDHGNRMGEIRLIEAGWYEDRLPFAFVHVPGWFAAERPEALANLAAHRDLLTSPFDLHMTLRDVLDDADPAARPAGGRRSGCLGCPRCASLFSAAGEAARSCADAGVDDQSCTCRPFVDVPTWSAEAKMAAAAVLRRVNNHLRTVDAHLDQPGHCALLRLSHLARARRVVQDESDYVDDEVTFTAGPGLLTFVANVRHWLHETPPRFESTGLDIRLMFVGDNACAFLHRNEWTRKLCTCLRAV